MLLSRLFLVGGLALSFIGLHSVAQENAKQVDPFSVYPFQVPSGMPQLSDYRQSFVRLTGFEHSGLHWGKFVSIYINRQAEVYANNYFEYLRQYQYEYPEDFIADMIALNQQLPHSFEAYAAGTVIVKENFNSGSGSPATAETLTAMIKHAPGYDPEYGDWEYIESDVSGKVLVRGKLADPSVYAKCGTCHESMAERNYVFSTFFSPSLVLQKK